MEASDGRSKANSSGIGARAVTRLLDAQANAAQVGILTFVPSSIFLAPAVHAGGTFAVEFDGTEHIRVPHSASIDFPNNSELTLEFWINPPVAL